jgi:hypothetical protein
VLRAGEGTFIHNDKAALGSGFLAPAQNHLDGFSLNAAFCKLLCGACGGSSGRLGTPRPVTAAEARELLDAHTVLLTYVLGAEQSHLLALSRDRLEVFELAPRRVLEDHAEIFYNALRESREAEGQWLLASRALGRLLLPPEAIPAGVDRLLVAPEGVLFYVPFAALGSPRAGAGEATRGRLVLDDFEVVTVPSAAVLAALRERRRAREPAAKTVAVFADPVFSVDDLLARAAASPGAPAAPGEPAAASPPATGRPSRAIVAERLPEGPLPRLPATAREAAAILARVPADLRLARLGPEATKQAVLGAEIGRGRGAGHERGGGGREHKRADLRPFCPAKQVVERVGKLFHLRRSSESATAESTA